MKQIVLYAPVYHAGHANLFTEHADAQEVLLLGESFATEYQPMTKEIRALPASVVAQFIRSQHKTMHVRAITPSDLPGALYADEIVVPDEDITRLLQQRVELKPHQRWLVSRTFLRWDREWSQTTRPVGLDIPTSADARAARLMRAALAAGQHSSDWWRQVGAVAARGDEMLAVAWNTHQPTEYAPYIDGDPRNMFHRGVRPDLSTALHAEARLIAEAARGGFDTKGADIYVSAFPCPSCAHLIAASNFARCFFHGSYSVLAGDEVLRRAGVELYWVEPSPPVAAEASVKN